MTPSSAARSRTAEAATGVVAGLGADGYVLALEGLTRLLTGVAVRAESG